MVLCTRFYTFVSYGILHMKRKYTKSKHLVVALVVCQLLPILEVQGSNLASSLERIVVDDFVQRNRYECTCVYVCVRERELETQGV